MTRIPVCVDCKHLVTPGSPPPRCLAFPEAIPRIITLEGDDHSESLPGDNGIQFEPRDE